MTGFFKRRRLVKIAREWLQHARLCRDTRSDIAEPSAMEALLAAETRLREAIDDGQFDRLEKECEALRQAASRVMPARSMAGLRENLEVIVVALGVAMAFRCYFLQPFKIPTGSMQPTLYGIHYEPQERAGTFDQHPLRVVKWALFGEWYVESKALTAGRVRGPLEQGGMLIYDIGGLVHPVPRGMTVRVSAGDEVVSGQVIASGKRITGDHLFVNRVKWNFVCPRRGEVMVFRTDGIPALDDKKTHYIKRMCGLPGERIRIVPPHILADERPVDDDVMIRAISSRAPGYAGYVLAEGVGAEYLVTTNDVLALKCGEYLACGDNTRNSFDGRYWGPVRQENLVGPAALVYWPISRRMGFIR